MGSGGGAGRFLHVAGRSQGAPRAVPGRSQGAPLLRVAWGRPCLGAFAWAVRPGGRAWVAWRQVTLHTFRQVTLLTFRQVTLHTFRQVTLLTCRQVTLHTFRQVTLQTFRQVTLHTWRVLALPCVPLAPTCASLRSHRRPLAHTCAPPSPTGVHQRLAGSPLAGRGSPLQTLDARRLASSRQRVTSWDLILVRSRGRVPPCASRPPVPGIRTRRARGILPRRKCAFALWDLILVRSRYARGTLADKGPPLRRGAPGVRAEAKTAPGAFPGP